MSKKNSGVFSNTYRMVLLGVFTAITLVLSFTPLGYLKIGVAEISFLSIPVAICACYLGVCGGTVLGAVFGLTSFIQCFGYSPFGVAMFSQNVIYCFIVCVVSRVLMGFLAGFISDLFKNNSGKIRHLKYTAVCIAAPVMNTLFFCGLLALLYGKIPLNIGDTDINVIEAIVIPAVTLNGIIEAIASCVIGIAICEAIYPVSKRARI